MNRIDDLEKRIRDNLLVRSGFAYPETLARKCEAQIRTYDTNKSGFLDYKGFFAAMTKLNFVAMTPDVECLFNRYDEDGTGLIDIKMFSACVCEFYSIGIFDEADKRNVSRLIQKLVAISGVDGISGLKNSIRDCYNRDSVTGQQCRDDTIISLRTFINGVSNYDVQLSDSELTSLYQCMNKASQGKTSLLFILNSIRNGHEYMTFERKLALRQCFYSIIDQVTGLDEDEKKANALHLKHLLQYFDPSAHPTVCDGLITPDQCAAQMVDLFELGLGNNSSRAYHGITPNDMRVLVTYESFLSYYKSISLAIPNTVHFKELLRNSWKVNPKTSSDGINYKERGYQMPARFVLEEPAATRTNFYSAKNVHASQRLQPGSSVKSYSNIMDQVANDSERGYSFDVNSSPSRSPLKLNQSPVRANSNANMTNTSINIVGNSLQSPGQRKGPKPFTKRVIIVYRDGTEATVDFILSPSAAEASSTRLSSSARPVSSTGRFNSTTVGYGNAPGNGTPAPPAIYHIPDKYEMLDQLQREGYLHVVDIRM